MENTSCFGTVVPASASLCSLLGGQRCERWYLPIQSSKAGQSVLFGSAFCACIHFDIEGLINSTLRDVTETDV